VFTPGSKKHPARAGQISYTFLVFATARKCHCLSNGNGSIKVFAIGDDGEATRLRHLVSTRQDRPRDAAPRFQPARGPTHRSVSAAAFPTSFTKSTPPPERPSATSRSVSPYQVVDTAFGRDRWSPTR